MVSYISYDVPYILQAILLNKPGRHTVASVASHLLEILKIGLIILSILRKKKTTHLQQ